jgi:hypothetical protein
MIWWAVFTCASAAFCGLSGGRFETPTRQTTEADCVFAAEFALDLLPAADKYRKQIVVHCEQRETGKEK